jgi:hypothetical protein
LSQRISELDGIINMMRSSPDSILSGNHSASAREANLLSDRNKLIDDKIHLENLIYFHERMLLEAKRLFVEEKRTIIQESKYLR